MGSEAITWSKEQQQRLQDILNEFWAQDVWELSHCPLVPEGTTGLRKFRFTSKSPALNTELKYACWQKFERGDWVLTPTATGKYANRVHHLIEWLNNVASTARSFMDRDCKEWEISFRSYLVGLGKWREWEATHLNRRQEPYQITHEDPRMSTLRQIYTLVQDAYDTRDPYERDIWDLPALGIQLNLSQGARSLSFFGIQQPWLRQAAKRYMRYRLATYSPADCLRKMASLVTFSQFLSQHHSVVHVADIGRTLILDYLGYLTSSNLSEATRIHEIVHLRDFLELCAREGWASVPEKPLIYSEDIPRRKKALPRFIPQEVLDQLNAYLDALPAHITRMMLLLQECGMRASELCSLPLDCLLQDASGDWFLRSYQSKMHKEHVIPISREGAVVIQEQRRTAMEALGQGCQYLFPSPKGLPFPQQTLRNALNRLAYEKDIRDATGKLWRFQSHQFRHTVATRMINLGVPLHIIQRYLGHETMEMTGVYAHLFDQTLKEEYAKFRGKTVDVTGRIVEQNTAANSSDLQWMKKNILAQALPNGKCALPVVAGDCPHANACLTCVHFRTDATFLPQHKAQLQETKHLIQVARSNGWKRQGEMNKKVAANLEHIITALEDTAHGA